LTTAAVTAITSYLLSEQLQETIVRYNQNKTDLQNVEIWWRALSPTDKEKPENIKKLVNTTEDLMIQEVKGWVQNMQDALSDLRKDLSESDQQSSSK
jgi:mRNA-degrading endonuclease HigB of HigAB toxin-antitoxin module